MFLSREISISTSKNYFNLLKNNGNERKIYYVIRAETFLVGIQLDFE